MNDIHSRGRRDRQDRKHRYTIDEIAADTIKAMMSATLLHRTVPIETFFKMIFIFIDKLGYAMYNENGFQIALRGAILWRKKRRTGRVHRNRCWII